MKLKTKKTAIVNYKQQEFKIDIDKSNKCRNKGSQRTITTGWNKISTDHYKKMLQAMKYFSHV